MFCQRLAIQAIASSTQIQIPIIFELIQNYFLHSLPLPRNPAFRHEMNVHFGEFRQMIKNVDFYFVSRNLKPFSNPERSKRSFPFLRFRSTDSWRKVRITLVFPLQFVMDLLQSNVFGSLKEAEWWSVLAAEKSRRKICPKELLSKTW